MKAITFLEWQIERIRKCKYDEFFDGEKELTLIRETAMFYANRFKPEMITEIFEGWECVSHGEDGYEYQNGDNVIEITGDECINIGYIDADDIVPLIPYLQIPKTLDSFISTVKEQTGIELTFKPEIVNKFFK